MNERTIDARLRSFQLKGDYKINNNGDIVAEPELVIQIAVPLNKETPALTAFLAQAKTNVGAAVSVTMSSPQAAFDFDALVSGAVRAR